MQPASYDRERSAWWCHEACSVARIRALVGDLSYTGVMSVDRSELHELIDELPDEQVASAADELRRRLRKPAVDRPWPPKWFGMIDDPDIPEDLAENVDKYLAEGFGSYRS